MADDITLTVRVRDMTRGEFSDIRRRMRGMDGDIRGLAHSSQQASDRADGFSRSLRGMSGRLGQLQRTGRLANSEMDYMRRSMGLLSRDMRQAARSGELAEGDYNRLRDELERTRLEFDRLDNELRRHNATSQRNARDAAAAQREELRQQQQTGQQIVNQQRRMSRAHAAALRENARRDAEDVRRQMSVGQQIVAQQRRLNRAHDAALREEAARNRQAEAERQRLATQAAARLRREESDFRRHVARLSQFGGNDEALTGRFQGLGGDDLNRMGRALRTISNAMNGVSASNVRARGTASALSNDMRVLSRVLGEAAQNGRLTRREFNAMSQGLTRASHAARGLHDSGALTRSAFRDTSREISFLRAQLRMLGDEGNSFDRLDGRLLIFQHRLRDTSRHMGPIRRGLRSLGSDSVGGMRTALRGVEGLLGGLRSLGGMLNFSKRWTAILIASLLLIGPIAQALGALLVTALGGAFIALGAFALRGSSEVRSAFKQMKETWDTVLTEAAAPLEGALVDGMQEVTVAARRMQPALTGAFAAAAPLVSDFMGGLTGLVESALPGFTKAMSESGPVMEGFKSAMNSIGKGLGDMFAAMTDGGGAKGLQKVWVILGTELQNLLVKIGEFINFASQSETVTALLVTVFEVLTGALKLLEGALSTVDDAFGGLLSNYTKVLGTTTVIKGKIGDLDLAKPFTTAADEVESLKQQLSDVDTRIAAIKAARDSAMAKGDGRDSFLSSVGATDADLLSATRERETLLGNIAAAESRAAVETGKHAGSVKELIGQLQTLAGLNRNYMDAQAAQEQAVADATKNQKKWGDALSWSNGQLKRNGQVGRDAYEQLSNIARTTKEATDKAVEANAPWEQINKRWKDGRESLIKLADGWGLNKEQAKQLADQILGIPPKKDVFVAANTAEAVTNLDAVITAMEATPDAQTIEVQALTGEAQRILEDLGYTVTRMPNGKFKITAETGVASAGIGAVQAARDKLAGKNIDIKAAVGSAVGGIAAVQRGRDNLSGKTFSISASVGQATGGIAAVQRMRDRLSSKSIRIDASTGAFNAAVGGIVGKVLGTAYINVQRRYDNQMARPFGAKGGSADSLPVRRFATGGDVLQGPGTKTSDSILARLSRGEFVMRAAAVDKYGVTNMRRINMGLLPKFAVGGSAKEAFNQIRSDTTISHFGKMAGWRTPEFSSALAKKTNINDIVTGFNDMRVNIQKATSGRTESRLLMTLDVAAKAMFKHQYALDKVNKKLEQTKEKLDGLKQAASQLKDSVKNAVLNDANITQSATGEDSRATINTVMSQMAASAANSKQFASMLDQLKRRGLSGDLISQIAQAGVNGGGMETAAAILGGGSSEIKKLNEFQKQIASSADSAGKVAADAMYGAGIRAAEGLVKGLTSQQKKIEKNMMDLAKFVEGNIKRALGIKSPSRVMMKIGSQTAEGFALGIENNKRPKHSWQSMLNIGQATGSVSTGSGASSGQPIVIQLSLAGKDVGEILIDPIRRSVRHRGGNVQAVLGK